MGRARGRSAPIKIGCLKIGWFSKHEVKKRQKGPKPMELIESQVVTSEPSRYPHSATQKNLWLICQKQKNASSIEYSSIYDQTFTARSLSRSLWNQDQATCFWKRDCNNHRCSHLQYIWKKQPQMLEITYDVLSNTLRESNMANTQKW